MAPRDTVATAAEVAGRSSKAEQFRVAAEIVRDLGDGDDSLDDAFVTLCVHSGIAAADVILMRKTGRYSKGASHADAVDALAKVSRELSRALATLLSMKTKAGYSANPVQARQLTSAERAMNALLAGMRG
ncbi:hypothetical protein Sked_37650 [Sanguibacter keddieii DSM 10542]|uniref:Uncharacterized protein n=1 Tax=Sanguibacter keddieii (strain ATCC 51767 / DSM 10542 / NCFB 3025 / ST-74) TaxID=446469 RepID=D1BGD1_SANKS|nr:hypothetical protein [Sanguibacter keddieii]ACZ23648.1 hypothetical protein Sked_37650 [Sanguibacter keddieii DSM 10542]